MKTRRILWGALAATLWCSAALSQMHGAGGQATQQTGPEQEPKNGTVSGPAADKTFIKKAMESNVGEIQMAQLALEKSTDADIRHFAVQMQDDHGRLMDELKQAAGQLNIPVPDQPSKGVTKSMEKMKGLSGTAFDQVYIKEMVKAHKEDDKAFKEEIRNTTSPQLKEMMTRDVQMIESHLQAIQQIAESKGKA